MSQKQKVDSSASSRHVHVLEVPPDAEKVTELIHALEDRCGGNVALRREELRAHRSEHMMAKVAARRAGQAEYAGSSELDLGPAPASILAKAGSKTASQPSGNRRSADEDRYVISARVGWHKILRAEGPAPVQPWKRAASMNAKRNKRLAAVTIKDDDPEVRMLIHQYVAKHALQLLNTCEEARERHRNAVAPQIEQAPTNLYAVCMEHLDRPQQHSNQKPLRVTVLRGKAVPRVETFRMWLPAFHSVRFATLSANGEEA